MSKSLFLDETEFEVPEQILSASRILRSDHIVKYKRKIHLELLDRYDVCYGFNKRIKTISLLGTYQGKIPSNIVYKITTMNRNKYVFKKFYCSEDGDDCRLDYIHEIWFNKLADMLNLRDYGFYVPVKQEAFIPGIGLGAVYDFVPDVKRGPNLGSVCKNKFKKGILNIVDYLIHNNDRWDGHFDDHISLLRNGLICLLDNAGNHYYDDVSIPIPRLDISEIDNKFINSLRNLDFSIFDGLYRDMIIERHREIMNELDDLLLR